jgi:hypothetical protein
VIGGDQQNPSVAFMNDGRWFGLDVYLPHRQLMKGSQRTGSKQVDAFGLTQSD